MSVKNYATSATSLVPFDDDYKVSDLILEPDEVKQDTNRRALYRAPTASGTWTVAEALADTLSSWLSFAGEFGMRVSMAPIRFAKMSVVVFLDPRR